MREAKRKFLRGHGRKSGVIKIGVRVGVFVAADVRRRIPLMDALIHLLTSVATLRFSTPFEDEDDDLKCAHMFIVS